MQGPLHMTILEVRHIWQRAAQLCRTQVPLLYVMRDACFALKVLNDAHAGSGEGEGPLVEEGGL